MTQYKISPQKNKKPVWIIEELNGKTKTIIHTSTSKIKILFYFGIHYLTGGRSALITVLEATENKVVDKGRNNEQYND